MIHVFEHEADNEVDAVDVCCRDIDVDELAGKENDEAQLVDSELVEIAIGRKYDDAFPLLRPLTTSHHVSPSDVSVSLDVCPGNSLRSDSSFSESQPSMRGAPDGYTPSLTAASSIASSSWW